MTAAEWNRRYPRGTPVRYWPNGKSRANTIPIETKTKTGAWHLGSGTAVVSLERVGAKPLTHIDPVPPAPVAPV